MDTNPCAEPSHFGDVNLHTLTNSLQCSAFMCCIDILGEGLYSLRIGRHGRHLGDVKLHQHSKGFIMLPCLVLSPPLGPNVSLYVCRVFYIRRAFIAPRHFEFTFIIDTYKEVKSIIKTSLNNKWKESHPEYNKQDGVYCLNIRGQTTIFRLRTGHNRLKYHIHKIRYLKLAKQISARVDRQQKRPNMCYRIAGYTAMLRLDSPSGGRE